MDNPNQVNNTNKFKKAPNVNKLNKVKFEKNAAYKNINTSECNKPLISNNIPVSGCQLL